LSSEQAVSLAFHAGPQPAPGTRSQTQTVGTTSYHVSRHETPPSDRVADSSRGSRQGP
jgi:hypothetical protein